MDAEGTDSKLDRLEVAHAFFRLPVSLLDLVGMIIEVKQDDEWLDRYLSGSLLYRSRCCAGDLTAKHRSSQSPAR